MEVEAAEARCIEHLAGEDAAVREDHRRVGALLADPGGEIRRFDLGWLVNREAEFQGDAFGRRRLGIGVATGWFIGLANDGHHLGTLVERAQRRDCDVRSAEEDRARSSQGEGSFGGSEEASWQQRKPTS